ncbi:MAG: DUF2905 domain-containing protein [Candidatus Omnitrophica bacterium]|nr:DUF2905 domain-containing protein [Candidatus Omnitrophota bacterium]
MVMELNAIGKILILFGSILLLAGGLLMVGGKIPWLGKLPGDIFIQKNNFTFFFPIMTCVIISLALSLVYILLRRR